MYSRYPNSKGEPLRIPEHYSGSAFAPPRREERDPPPRPKRYPEVARPTPPAPLPLPPPVEEPPKREPEKASPPIPPPHSALLEGLGRAFPFSHGIGSEELLILGLILLLARNGQDSDMVLWLALLLFCG